jgi:hypothetical protein
MSASDQEILAALPAVLGDRVVAVDDVTAALTDAGIDMGPDPAETLRRATSMEGSIGDLVGGFMHLPTFLDGTTWSIEVTEVDLETGSITEPLGIDPLIWWMVTDDVATVDADGQVLGLIEVDSFDGRNDSLLLPDAVVDTLRPGWVAVTLHDGATRWTSADAPTPPTAAQVASTCPTGWNGSPTRRRCWRRSLSIVGPSSTHRCRRPASCSRPPGSRPTVATWRRRDSTGTRWRCGAPATRRR